MVVKMNELSKIKYKLFNILLASILGFSFSLAIVTSYGFEYNYLNIFLFIFIMNIFLSLIFYNKKTTAISLIIFLFLIIELFMYCLFRNELLFWTNLINSFMNSFLNSFYELVTNSLYPKNIFFQTIYIDLIYIVISIIIFIFAVKYFNFIILMSLVSIVYVVQWHLHRYHSKTAFLLSVGMIIIYYFKHIFIKYYRNNTNKKKIALFIISIIPLAALILFIVFQIPKPSITLDKWMNNTFGKKYYSMSVFDQENEYFSFFDTGFGNKGKLGGNANPDDTLVLKVKSNKRIYLRGNILDKYDGNSWVNSTNTSIPKTHDYSFIENTSLEEYNEVSFDLNMMNSCNKYLNLEFHIESINDELIVINNSSNLNDSPINLSENKFIDNNENLEIEYVDIITKTVFHTLKTNKYIFDKYNKAINIHDNSIISTDTFLTKGTSYIVKYFYINDNSLNVLLKNTSYNFYKSMYDYCNNSSESNEFKNFCVNNYVNITYLNKVSEIMYYKYLQLPEKLPQRVKELAVNITVDYNNLYDKIKAVESYLSTNYSYTLNTNNLPLDRDFVDYFLFEEKEGYCTYYASAMVILLRSIGIPARYIEGFMLPDNKENGNYYYVTNQNAHAWPEVYLDGYGQCHQAKKL